MHKTSLYSRVIFKVLLLLFTCALLASGIVGCTGTRGAKISSPLDLTNVPMDESITSVTADKRFNNTYLYIDEFIDARTQPHLVRVQGRDIMPEGELVPLVLKALQDGMSKKGFSFSESAPIAVSGKLLTWTAELPSSGSNEVRSEMRFEMEVYDPANKKIYTGNYFGQSTVKAPSISEEELKAALMRALGEAVKQCIADKRLLELLSAY